jgi:4'-phosphopantetheinyl transferase
MMLEIPYAPPPSDLRLADNEINIFNASLDQPLSRTEQLVSYLSNDERTRAARFHFESDQSRFITGRGMLREILGWLLQVKPDELVFSYSANGKPRLVSPFGRRVLHFNLAHSDGLVVYAMSPTQEVGVDVERIRSIPDMELMVDQFLSKREVAQWYSLPDRQRLHAFFNAWTQKEAYLKATGEGVSKKLNHIEVLFAPTSKIGAAGLLQSIICASGFAGAVAAKGNIAHLNYWMWQCQV